MTLPDSVSKRWARVQLALGFWLCILYLKRSFAVKAHVLHARQQQAAAFCDQTVQQDLKCIALSPLRLQEL